MNENIIVKEHILTAIFLSQSMVSYLHRGQENKSNHPMLDYSVGIVSNFDQCTRSLQSLTSHGGTEAEIISTMLIIWCFITPSSRYSVEYRNCQG